jgi:RNA methyltransferase, TrmH family
MQLTSTKNPVLQAIRRAAAAGRPTEHGLIVVEGPHLVEEAVGGAWQIEQIFATARARARHPQLLVKLDAEVIEVSERAFVSTAATDTPQEILALLRPPKWSWKDLLGGRALVVALDGIQDPGNAGTIVRSAEAFGASGVVFLKGCVRVANGKLLRAAAGSMFRVPFVEAIGVKEFLDEIRLDGVCVYALSMHASKSLHDADLQSKCVFAVGSEGVGMSPELLAAAQCISIPTVKVESLNAATACSIALFEAYQQRNAQ